MNIKKLALAATLASLFSPAVTYAGFASVAPTVTTIGGGTNTVNRGYVGLKWTLGAGVTPAVVVGFRHARVQSNGDTKGGDVSFSFNLVDGIHAGKIRTKYFNGQEKVQGEVGAGFDFTHGIFIGAGVNAPYSNVGLDYLFSSGSPWQPFFMLDTLKKYNKSPSTTTSSCLSGYTLNTGTGLCDFVGGA